MMRVKHLTYNNNNRNKIYKNNKKISKYIKIYNILSKIINTYCALDYRFLRWTFVEIKLLWFQEFEEIKTV